MSVLVGLWIPSKLTLILSLRQLLVEVHLAFSVLLDIFLVSLLHLLA